MMNDQQEYYLARLRDASEALDAACRLLDKRFGSRAWRQDWSIADTAADIRREAFGFDTFEAADVEAQSRRAKDGRPWGACFSAEGYPMVSLIE